MSRDSVTVAVDGVIYFSIKDALRCIVTIFDYRYSAVWCLTASAISTLRNNHCSVYSFETHLVLARYASRIRSYGGQTPPCNSNIHNPACTSFLLQNDVHVELTTSSCNVSFTFMRRSRNVSFTFMRGSV